MPAGKLYNLARMTTATTGTGTITLGSAVSGYLTFALAGVQNGDVVAYGIKDGSNSEAGYGTYTSSGTTLSRTVTKSTNSNAAINLSGTAEVFITPRAEDLLSFVSTMTLTAAEQGVGRNNISAALKGHIFGLTLSNNASDATNDIDIAVGECASTETDPVLMRLTSALTKRLDASWSVGSGNGGLDTGSIANTTYHVWLIQRSDTGVVDALFSTSASSPTMPANYDRKRRIGSIVRLSGSIRAFLQIGNKFMFKTPISQTTFTNPGTSAVTRSISGIPAGIKVEAHLTFVFLNLGTDLNDSVQTLYVSDPDLDNATVGTSGAASYYWYSTGSAGSRHGVQVNSFTDTSSQVRTRQENSTANTRMDWSLNGYSDYRGIYQ